MSWQLALEGASQSQPASDSPLLLLPGSAQVGRGQTAIIRSTHQLPAMDFSKLRIFVSPARTIALDSPKTLQPSGLCQEFMLSW